MEMNRGNAQKFSSEIALASQEQLLLPQRDAESSTYPKQLPIVFCQYKRVPLVLAAPADAWPGGKGVS